jgi:AraC-like DNA-binding protein
LENGVSMTTLLLARLDDWEHLAREAGYNVGGLAKLCGVSDRHLRRVFEKRFGRSPRSMLNERRMSEAQVALGTEHLVKEIASDLHYKHPGSFSHWFKTRQNMTPSEFASRGSGISKQL